ncbi:MAG: ChaN family lipoprotein [Candidatus Cloacimonetes bacterium]|nr:ChaN family lipoprotein [Candidatus Cloacimonadota bacterium]
MKSLLLLVLFVFTATCATISESQIKQELEFTQSLHCELGELKKSFGVSESFNTYEKEYFDRVNSTKPSLLNEADFYDRLNQSKIIVMADNHVSFGSQTNTINIIQRQSKSSKKLILVIEWIDRSFQAVVNQYLLGQLSLDELKSKVLFDELWAFSWESYSRILKAAKDQKVPIYLVENLKNTKDLTSRDDEITKLVNKLLQKNAESQVMVVYGTYHILGKNHLFQRFLKLDKKTTAIVSQAEQAYWTIVKQTKDSEKLRQFKLAERVMYLHDSKPLHQLEDERYYYLNLLGWDEEEYFCD